MFEATLRRVWQFFSIGNGLDLEVQFDQGEDEALQVLDQVVKHAQAIGVSAPAGQPKSEHQFQRRVTTDGLRHS